MSLVVDEHRQYLEDQPRLSAFRRAIHATVRAGDVVIDLGSGTGILGMFACEAGARHVYAIEEGGMIQVARAVARANGLSDRITFIAGVSTDVTLSERADVVVADQIGRFGFEAGVIEYFADAAVRLLRSGGRTVPQAITLVCAPIEAPELFAQADFWAHRPAGLDFTPAREWAINTGYPSQLSASMLLAEPHAFARADLSGPRTTTLDGSASFTVTRRGTLHGVGAWFDAMLAEGVRMTNSPLAADRIARRNVYLPIDRPVAVHEGDRIIIEMHIAAEEVMVSWNVTVSSDEAPPHRFVHSTLKGMLITREELRRMQPDYVPRLTPRGAARRTVLELCDGVRTLQQIERVVHERHRDLFPSADNAAAFVAEVVTRYTGPP